MLETVDIELWVEYAARSNIKRFYPSALDKEIDLPPEVIFEKLLLLTRDGKLILQWELRCPECYRTCLTLEEGKNVIELIECAIGHEFEITEDNVFPVFEINKDYKKRLERFKKKLSQHHQLLHH